MSSYNFAHRFSCRLTVLGEMVVEGVAIVVVIGWDVFHYLKRMGKLREFRGGHGSGGDGVISISTGHQDVLELIGELDFWSVVGHAISLLGLFVALLILITGIRVLIGPCQLTPQVTERRPLKSAIKVCSLWCALTFLRFILLLLGLSLRLMVFSLLAFDELTNAEIAKQATILLPLASSLTAMATTAKFRAEVEVRYASLLPQLPDGFQIPQTSYVPG